MHQASCADNPTAKEIVDFSIVAPIFNGSGTVEKFVFDCQEVMRQLKFNSFEIILVDDGSQDDSAEKIIRLQKEYNRVCLIKLSRNFGQHKAILAGLRESSGKFVVCMDGDGDENPHWIIDFWSEMKKTGSDIVIGVNKKNLDNFLFGILRKVFFLVLGNRNSRGRGEVTARLLKRTVVDAVKDSKEYSFQLGNAIAQIGFKRSLVEVVKSRQGESQYNFARLFSQSVAAITSHSSTPLRVLTIWGCVVSVISIISIALLLTSVAIGRSPSGTGWISLSLLVTFFGGNSLLALGVIGEYISLIVSEVKNRPQYVIREVRKGNNSQ